MRAVIQRVREARVVVEGKVTGRIDRGLLVLLGIHKDDNADRAAALVRKIMRVRVFADGSGKMNLDLKQVRGGLLIVSQFTLYGDTRKGTRPSYSDAATLDKAESLYTHFLELCRGDCPDVQTGIFQARMEVMLVNDGPVTLIFDS